MSLFDKPKPPPPPAPPPPPDTLEAERAQARTIAANKQRRGRKATRLVLDSPVAQPAQPALGTAAPLGA